MNCSSPGALFRFRKHCSLKARTFKRLTALSAAAQRGCVQGAQFSEQIRESGRTWKNSRAELVSACFQTFQTFQTRQCEDFGRESRHRKRERGSAIRTDSNGFGIWLRNLGRCRSGFHRSWTGGSPDWTRPEKGYIKRCATLKSLYSCLAAPVYLIYLEVQMEDATYTYVYSIHIYLYSDLETLISRFKPWSLKMDSAFAVPLGHRLVRLAKVLLE